MIEEIKRDFKGVWIPKEVWLDDRLSALDKIILTEIDSLDIDENGCYASNEYLAEFCQCSDTKVSTAVNKLIKLGYLEVIKFDGRKRYLKSRLLIFKKQTLKKLKADFKKVKDNNIDNNIDNNNIYNMAKEVINYLNLKTNKSFRYTQNNINRIKTRLKEGFTLDDFKKVIDIKSLEWLKDSKMNTYLRPETLFGNKFESYLQQGQKEPKWLDKEYTETKATELEEESIKDMLREVGIDI